MGGSGTGGIFASDIASVLEEARRRLQESQVDSAVNSLLQQELVSVNSRDVPLVSEHLDSIQEALAGKGHQIERLQFGGSVAKHTYVDGLSDIDALVLLEDESLGEQSPSDVRRDFAESLRRALPQGNIKIIREGAMAVTIEYVDGMEIQVLPAARTASGIAVSSWDGNSWSPILPQAFARALTKANQDQGGGVVPAIKLAKSILANNLDGVAVSGYHMEALAVEAFRAYSGPRTPKAMLAHLVEYASQGVLTPIRDMTRQSRYVDDYLGETNSSSRLGLSRSLATLAKTMARSQSSDEWMELLN